MVSFGSRAMSNGWVHAFRRPALALLLAASLLVLAVSPAVAVSTTSTVSATVSVNARAKLALSSNTLTFPDDDPDVAPSLSPTEGAMAVTVKARTAANSAVTLTVIANGDFTNGNGDTIPISNLTWSGSGSGFQPSGTMSKTTAQAVGTWTGSGVRNGSLSFALANDWNYAAGSQYTATLTFTLTAP